MSKLIDYAKEFAHKKFVYTDDFTGYNKDLFGGFITGFALGTEFAEWASNYGWVCHDVNGEKFWRNVGGIKTTPELTELFLNDKMKEK